jgi:hypothetical protein
MISSTRDNSDAVAAAGVIYEAREYAENGGLISYGQVWAENFERAASLVDKIFMVACLLYHLVRADQQRLRHSEPECLGGF